MAANNTTSMGYLRCDVCQAALTDEKHVVSHLKAHVGKPGLQCHLCFIKTFTNESHFFKHMKIHQKTTFYDTLVQGYCNFAMSLAMHACELYPVLTAGDLWEKRQTRYNDTVCASSLLQVASQTDFIHMVNTTFIY